MGSVCIRSAVGGLLCAVLVLWSAGAEAQPSATTTPPVAPGSPEEVAYAKAYFERGMAHFQLDEYAQAIEQWEAGFRLKRDPAFLYNIAQAYRLSKQPEKAISFYNKFLKMSPKAANRAEVEKHIAALEKQMREQPADQTAATPPTTTTPPPVEQTGNRTGDAASTASTSSTPVTNDAADGSSAGPAQKPQLTAPNHEGTTGGTDISTPPPAKPIYKKAWFWGAVGGAAVLATVAVILLTSGNEKVNQLPEVVF